MENEPSPWDKWAAKNLATPQQKIKWYLIVWGVFVLMAPIAVYGEHDPLSRNGAIIFIAIFGWVPALIIFIKHRRQQMNATEDDET